MSYIEFKSCLWKITIYVKAKVLSYPETADDTVASLLFLQVVLFICGSIASKGLHLKLQAWSETNAHRGLSKQQTNVESVHITKNLEVIKIQ